jgi:hypothetical protein
VRSDDERLSDIQEAIDRISVMFSMTGRASIPTSCCKARCFTGLRSSARRHEG